MSQTDITASNFKEIRLRCYVCMREDKGPYLIPVEDGVPRAICSDCSLRLRPLGEFPREPWLPREESKTLKRLRELLPTADELSDEVASVIKMLELEEAKR